MDFIGFGLPDFHKNIDLIEIYHLYKNLILSSKWFTSKKHNIKKLYLLLYYFTWKRAYIWKERGIEMYFLNQYLNMCNVNTLYIKFLTIALLIKTWI